MELTGQLMYILRLRKALVYVKHRAAVENTILFDTASVCMTQTAESAVAVAAKIARKWC